MSPLKQFDSQDLLRRTDWFQVNSYLRAILKLMTSSDARSIMVIIGWYMRKGLALYAQRLLDLFAIWHTTDCLLRVSYGKSYTNSFKINALQSKFIAFFRMKSLCAVCFCQYSKGKLNENYMNRQKLIQ